MSTNEQVKGFNFSETFILALISSISYWTAFNFEKGYLDFFGIPDTIIKISIESFFYTLGFTCVFFYLAWVLFDILDTIVKNISPGNHQHLDCFIPLIFIIFMVPLFGWWLFNAHGILQTLNLSLVLVWLSMLLFTHYLEPIFSNGSLNYFERVSNSFKQTSNSEGVFDKIRKKKGAMFVHMLYLGFFCLACLPFIAMGFGNYIAGASKRFPTTHINNEAYALIRKYDDLMVYTQTKKIWTGLYTYDEVPQEKFILWPIGEAAQEYTKYKKPPK